MPYDLSTKPSRVALLSLTIVLLLFAATWPQSSAAQTVRVDLRDGQLPLAAGRHVLADGAGDEIRLAKISRAPGFLVVGADQFCDLASECFDAFDAYFINPQLCVSCNNGMGCKACVNFKAE